VPTLQLEALLALLVLAAAAVLSATPVPQPDFAAPPPPSAVAASGEYMVETTITPGGSGVNTYDTVITRGGEPVDGLTVHVRMVNPSQDWRGVWHDAENLGDGLYAAAGDDIDRAGHWLTVVAIKDGEVMTRALFEWDISADAGVIESIAPRWLNLMALAGVVLACGYAASPLARRFYARLDLSPTTVTAALGAILTTVVVVIVAAVAIQQAQEQYEATLNPPPLVVNAVLPDSTSLERGQALLSQGCPGWQEGADWDELLRRLTRLRDEELFSYVSEGWRALPPCDGSFSETQRWDAVNYIRSLERF
jgi:hypothetical protein